MAPTRRSWSSGVSQDGASLRHRRTRPRAEDAVSTATEESASGQPAPGGGAPPEAIKAIPARHPTRWIATVLVFAAVALFIIGVSTNSRFQWGVVGRYFTSTSILQGLVRTLELT